MPTRERLHTIFTDIPHIWLLDGYAVCWTGVGIGSCDLSGCVVWSNGSGNYFIQRTQARARHAIQLWQIGAGNFQHPKVSLTTMLTCLLLCMVCTSHLAGTIIIQQLNMISPCSEPEAMATFLSYLPMSSTGPSVLRPQGLCPRPDPQQKDQPEGVC